MVRKFAILMVFVAFAAVLVCAAYWTFRVALGISPVLGSQQIDMQHMHDFVTDPQFWDALVLSVSSGLIATFVSLLLSFGLLASAAQTKLFQKVLRVLSPVLALPHALLAMSILVLFAPTGWLVRSIWWLSSTPNTPPDYHFAPDSWGGGLILSLVIKETAFLVLMLLSHIENSVYAKQLNIARSLGYAPIAAWCKVLVPQLYPKIRLPLFAVLVFSASNVEVPLITNTYNAPTLSIMIFRHFQDANLQMLFQAAAGSVVMFVVCIGLVLVWWVGEKIVAKLMQPWLSRGARYWGENLLPRIITVLFAAILLILLLGFAALILHSISFRWAFPDLFPESTIFSRTYRMNIGAYREAIYTSASLASISSGVSVVLSLIALLSIPRAAHHGIGSAIYLPLLLPQIAMMMGMQLLLLSSGIKGGFLIVVLLHIVFVLPYVYISLAGALRLMDGRYVMVAQTFGMNWWKRLYKIVIPMMIRPILVAFALGFSVSSAQFLPTLLASRGRTETLMTHFMLVAAGGNLREFAFVGLLLVVLVAVPFWLALWLPKMLFAHRRGMRFQD